MMRFLNEMFLTEYFRYKVLLGDYFKNNKSFFYKLGEIFLIPKDVLDVLYDKVENERITEIRTENDFNLYQRELQYFSLAGVCTDTSQEEQDLILIKGNAIVQIKEINCLFETQQTDVIIGNNLTFQASQGSVLAMRLTAFLMLENIFLNGNQKQGLNLLSKASSWNDIVSLIYMLHYVKGNKSIALTKLNYLLNKKAHDDVFSYIEQCYGKCKLVESKEVELLEALFKIGILKRENYSAPYARALYSEVLDCKNKEKLFFSTTKDFSSMAGDLPLKLSFNNSMKYDYSIFSKLPLKRDSEFERIKRSLTNSDLRQKFIYRPPCLVSNSNYLCSLYIETFRKIAANSNVELITVSELDMHDFEPNKNNIFVRLCNEDKENIYLLYLQGEISEKVISEITSFLKTQNRRKFRISTPNIALDISSILPICICDEHNEHLVKNYCETIKLCEISDKEKPMILDSILKNKAFDYDVPIIKLLPETKEELLKLSIDDIEMELDAAIRNNRQKGSEMILSKDKFDFDDRSSGNSRYGFGGIINENK